MASHPFDVRRPRHEGRRGLPRFDLQEAERRQGYLGVVRGLGQTMMRLSRLDGELVLSHLARWNLFSPLEPLCNGCHW